MQKFRVLAVVAALSVLAGSMAGAVGPKAASRGAKVSAQAKAPKAATPANAGQRTRPAKPRDTASRPSRPDTQAANADRSIAANISKNPHLQARVQTMLPPNMTIEQAASGFRNQGQFIAALEASKNENIPFVDLKREMTGDNPLGLGQAIQKLRPERPIRLRQGFGGQTTGEPRDDRGKNR
jgi:hypothetical protein